MPFALKALLSVLVLTIANFFAAPQSAWANSPLLSTQESPVVREKLKKIDRIVVDATSILDLTNLDWQLQAEKECPILSSEEINSRITEMLQSRIKRHNGDYVSIFTEKEAQKTDNMSLREKTLTLNLTLNVLKGDKEKSILGAISAKVGKAEKSPTEKPNSFMGEYFYITPPVPFLVMTDSCNASEEFSQALEVIITNVANQLNKMFQETKNN